jgi:hypothetical protein
MIFFEPVHGTQVSNHQRTDCPMNGSLRRRKQHRLNACLKMKMRRFEHRAPILQTGSFANKTFSKSTKWNVREASESAVRKLPTRLQTLDQNSLLLSKSSLRGWPHQNRPDRKQQVLNRSPLPHGHGSLRPSFSTSCLSPWTTLTPRLTFVSDGKPRRRLLIRSKAFVVVVIVSHWSAPY